MTPKTCDVCGIVFSSKFCPECGRKYSDIKVSIPVEFVVYLHGDEEDGYGYDWCNEYGVDPKSKLGQEMIGLTYEVKLVYNLIDDKPILIQVDTRDTRGLCDVIPRKND